MSPQPEHQIPTVAVTTTDAGVAVTLARMEAKIDVVLAQHEAKIEQHSDNLQDHEERLRALEAKPTVSPRVLWTTVASIIAAVATVAPLLSRLYS